MQKSIVAFALASLAAWCCLTSFVGLTHDSLKKLRQVRTSNRQAKQQIDWSAVTVDAKGRFRFKTGAMPPSKSSAILTNDSKGRFRFAQSKQTTSSEFVTDEEESVLTQDAAGRFRFVAEMAAPASAPMAAPASAPPSATSVSEPSRVADGSNMAVSFLGPAFAFIAVLALVGNMAGGGPSKEELDRRRAEEAAAATRTTAFTTLGLAAGIAYVVQKPGQKNSKAQQEELRQEARKAVAEWKLVRKNTQKGMGVMWSGDY